MFDRTETRDDSTSNSYMLLILLAGFTAALYAAVRRAEANNRLHYTNRFARVLAGSLLFIINCMHTKKSEIPVPNGALIAIGPHRTGWESAVVASKMQGTPPQFFSTTSYNVIPGVAAFLKMFKAILVEPSTKGEGARLANVRALESASQILKENGRVAIFPQGNFARLGEEPPRIYPGVAKLALKNKIPIYVIRLDGFWCLQNPYIPLSLRNNAYYRAFFSFLHANNIRTTLCMTIDFHLEAENERLSDAEKIDEICAQLYAYYRHTEELDDLVTVKNQITNNEHRLFWKNKVHQDERMKQPLVENRLQLG